MTDTKRVEPIMKKLSENEKFKSMHRNDRRFIEDSLIGFKGNYPSYISIRNKNNESMFIELAVIRHILVIKLTEHNLLDFDRVENIKERFELGLYPLREGIRGRNDLAKFLNSRTSASTKEMTAFFKAHKYRGGAKC